MVNEEIINIQTEKKRRSVIILFILSNILYRLLSGAMVVAFTWLLTVNTGEKDIYLAIAIIVSFIPAFFVPKIIKSVGLYKGGKRLTYIFIFCMSILMAVVSQITDSPVLVVIGNLLAWLLMLMMEASLDMWYTSLQRSLSELNAHRLSGVVTSSSQAAIMIGPILLSPLVSRIEYHYIFYILSAL
jgi:Na+/melibiose symporter-like transporter